MTNATHALPLITDDSRHCPACGQDTLEFFVTMRRASHAAADCVNTSGPRKGTHFHVAAECECGGIYEVAR